MIKLQFQAVPLTPIHVGNGDTLAPEDYLLQGNQLLRFNRATVLRDMSLEQRRQLESALDKNDFAVAQEIMRSACDLERHILSRIQIGDESRSALQELVKRPDTPVRQREVHPFVFNPLTGQPYLPGSSIKGAIRTALVNHFAQQGLETIKPQLETLERKKRWRVLEMEALNFTHSHMENDPLRLFKVADVALPVDNTRVDRALQFKRGKGLLDIQMHYERLLCRADGANTEFQIEMELDDKAAAHSRVQPLLGRKLSFDLIREACNAFYWGRMNAELDRFFPRDDPQMGDIYKKVKVGLAVHNAENKLVLAPPPWKERLLLRIGRFSQFESLSVDNLRQGWNIQKKQPITEGSSRTLCRCRAEAGASIPLPFGWLLLKRVDK